MMSRITLLAFMAALLVSACFASEPKYPDISGDWICTDKCQKPGGIAKIGQDGGSLTLINEVGASTTGYFENETRIRSAPGGGWSDVRGNLSSDVNQINWANGSIWRRNEAFPEIAGDWICTDKCQKPGGIAKIGQDGGSLTLVNEVGASTTGYFENETRIRSNAGGGWGDIRGILSEDQNQINWHNGSVWRRK